MNESLPRKTRAILKGAEMSKVFGTNLLFTLLTRIFEDQKVCYRVCQICLLQNFLSTESSTV